MPRPLVFLILALPLVGAYGLYAVGIVSIYRASRVLNLAHGGIATVPAFLVYAMVKAGVPMPLAFVLGVASGAVLGLAVERVFVRRLRSISTTAQTVGTVAALGILISVTAKIWGTGGLTAPSVFPEGHLNVGSSILRYGHIGLFAVAVCVTIALYVALDRTWFGLAMRGAAVNRRGAALAGVNPDSTTAAAWALGGALAALAGILLAAVTTLHPYTLSLSVLPAFVAALIAGLDSMPAALGGAAIVGVVIGFVPVLADLPVFRVVIGQLGGAELTLAVTAMIVMALRGGRLVGSDVRGDPAEAGVRVRVEEPRLARRLPAPLALLAGVALIGWVFIPMDGGLRFSLLGDANQALLFALATVSLVLLVGWVGQISLAQAAFVGVGAYATTFAIRRGVPFPFTIPVAAAVSAAVAALLGLVALRVRGLYLAVATLIFAWMADYYLFSAPWLVGSGGSISIRVDPIGPKGGFPYFDFTERRTFYFLVLAAATLAVLGCANLRRSKSGRAFFAIRGSEVAAASLGIDVTRYKLLAFGLSGAIAGLAGSLIATHQQTIVPAQFAFTFSLFYLSVAVVGGLQSLGGAVSASIVFAALNQLFFRVDALRGWLDVVSAGLLAGVLLFYPGGLAAIPRSLGRVRAILQRVRRRVPQAETVTRRLRLTRSQ
ncbi:MAG: ABC transporter permease, partial [Actinomycetota bacterium]